MDGLVTITDSMRNIANAWDALNQAPDANLIELKADMLKQIDRSILDGTAIVAESLTSANSAGQILPVADSQAMHAFFNMRRNVLTLLNGATKKEG